MKKYIFTGGPHSGKTTILELMEQKGFAVLAETSRIIIQEEQRRQKSDPSYKVVYPWENQRRFCQLFHALQLKRESSISAEIIFLDRCLIDPIAYAEVAEIELDSGVYQDVQKANYAKKAFYFDLIPDYRTDGQRRDDPNAAMAVHAKLYEVYGRLGFEPITVPLFSTDEADSKQKRLDFILEHIRSF